MKWTWTVFNLGTVHHAVHLKMDRTVLQCTAFHCAAWNSNALHIILLH